LACTDQTFSNSSENKTRIIKLTSLDGEYMLLGRKTVDTANIFVQYGFGATRTVNLTGGKGIQQAEFIDGLQLAVELDREMRININLKNGIDPKALPSGMQSLCKLHPTSRICSLGSSQSALDSFAWAINSSTPNQQLKNASVSFPGILPFFNPLCSFSSYSSDLIR
jgi:hypothetical protein